MNKLIVIILAVSAGLMVTACQEPETKTSEAIEQLTAPVIDTAGIAELKANGWVNDFEGIFAVNEKQSLDSLLAKFEKETAIKIAIVTLDTSMIGEEITDMYEATLAIARNWSIGAKENNNSILIGICKGRKHMYVQNGRGIEKLLPDEETQQIIDEVFFLNYAQGKFFEGTYEGLNTMMVRLRAKK